MFKRIWVFSSIILCTVLVGCGGTSIEVSVEGEGVVTSNPEGIECGLGIALCKKTFSSSVENIVLTASPPSDGSYEFSRWEGECSNNHVNCVLTDKAAVTAVFVSTDVQGSLPNKPNGLSVSSMSTKRFLVQWGASEDLVTKEPELQYRIYLSESSIDIVSQANLVATVQGSGKEEYSYDLNVEETGIGLIVDSYSVAVTALDTDGFEGVPLIVGDLALAGEDIELMSGIELVDAIAEGYPIPVITEDNTAIYYAFNGVDSEILPAVGDILTYPSEDNGVEYDELLKVIDVTGSGFVSIVISLGEITSEPLKIFGAGKLGESKEPEVNEPQTQVIVPSSDHNTGIQEVECEAENISKLNIAAEKGFKEPEYSYSITLLENPLCVSEPETCFSGDDYVGLTYAAEPKLIANFNMQGGECFLSEAEKPIVNKDLLELKAFGKYKLKAGKLRVDIKLAYAVNASSSAAVIMSNELKLQNLGFTLAIKAEGGPEVTTQTPSVVFTPSNTLQGSVDYTIVLEPKVAIEFDVIKAGGFDYTGGLANTFNGVVSAKSLSDLNPEDVYLDKYDLDLKAQYTHTFTPILYIAGWDAIQDETAYESDVIAVFNLPGPASEPIAESFDDDEMCRLTYTFSDGINNPLETSPFEHYLIFNDATEVSLGQPVSITKSDNVTTLIYEFSQQELFDNYVSIAKEKAYKRIARGASRIGDTVVDNTEFKNL